MKILFLSDDFPPEVQGGAGIIAYTDAIALSKAGQKVEVITVVGDRNKAGKREEKGITVHSLYSKYPEFWRGYVALANIPLLKQVEKIIKDFTPNVVHAHNIHAHISYAALKLAKKSGAKVFLTFHDLMAVHYGKLFPTRPFADHEEYKISFLSQIRQYGLRYKPFRNTAIRHYLKYADKLFSVSGAVKTVLEKYGIGNIEVLHNGIDVEAWVIDEAALQNFKNKYNLHGKKVIFFGGRLSGGKGLFSGVEALHILKECGEKCHLFILGNANSPAAIKAKKMAGDYAMAAQLIFPGWLPHEEVKYALAASDIVAVLSLYLDPFPTVNLEAMAAKKAVVGTKFGGTKEVVLDGETGIIVNPYNKEAVADAFQKLLVERELRARMGEGGYERVKKDFSLDAHIHNLLKWYND